ncbi:hypothetical protein [uncultured Aquimarina sp.]|uniref:hypothetical protein n=1 Tax=uncultured Aquimarina sp. TaxID=575652 RepID=UPI00263612D5|nr:hypothetical protein [uncultured Aquimarina sp.]
MNTSFKETIINDEKRVVVRIAHADTKLKPKILTRTDIDFLLQGDNFFAQKFDESILSILEEVLTTSQITNNSNSIDFNFVPTFNIDTKKSDLLDLETITNPPTQLRKLNGNK